MAGNRKHIETVPVLKTWEDVNDALRQIALEEIAIDEIEGDMNKQILGMKKVAEQQKKPHNDRIGKLAADIKAYVDSHRDELGQRKTVSLTFGECGYRQSTSVQVPTARDKLAEIIRRLRARKMEDCITVKESVNKDALRQYGEEAVLEVGAKWVQKDGFWYEAAREKLEQLHAGQL